MKSALKANINILIIVTILVSACSIRGTQNTPTAPNIVLILTDDMTLKDLAYMPITSKLLAAEGASFSQFLVTMSLCCPSRVAILRGQYPHNSGIIGNTPPDGGFEKAYELGLEGSTLAVWLQQVGYRTALIGKYLNGYPASDGVRNYIPPGWTEWYTPAGDMRYNDSAYTGFGYLLNKNGDLVRYGDKPEDYATDVFANLAVDFIKRAGQADKPFFAYITPYAPHSPSVPAPRHANLFPDIQLPDTPSINEEDVSDKSRFFSRNPLLTEQQLADMRTQYRNRIQSLQAVDEMVGNIHAVLVETGQIDNTYIFFASDNGFHLGEHRLLDGKNSAFEEDILVPLLVRGPGIKPGITIDKITANIDLAPTIAELAGVTPPDFVDGRSLVPLLTKSIVFNWRQGISISKGAGSFQTLYNPVAALAGSSTFISEQEPRDSVYDGKPGGQFTGLRTEKYTYVEFLNGDIELYDLQNDPYELNNIAAGTGSKLLDKLHAWLVLLKDCRAESCRQWDREP